MDFNIELVETKPQPALIIKTITSAKDLPSELQIGYGKIINHIKSKGGKPIGPAFTAYYNMDMEHLQVDLGFPTAEEMPGQSEIIATNIPGGKRITTTYKGPYSGMENAYSALTKYIAENNLIPTGVVYEYYYNSPEEVKESELLTKIEFLIK